MLGYFLHLFILTTALSKKRTKKIVVDKYNIHINIWNICNSYFWCMNASFVGQNRVYQPIKQFFIEKEMCYKEFFLRTYLNQEEIEQIWIRTLRENKESDPTMYII